MVTLLSSLSNAGGFVKGRKTSYFLNSLQTLQNLTNPPSSGRHKNFYNFLPQIGVENERSKVQPLSCHHHVNARKCLKRAHCSLPWVQALKDLLKMQICAYAFKEWSACEPWSLDWTARGMRLSKIRVRKVCGKLSIQANHKGGCWLFKG